MIKLLETEFGLKVVEIKKLDGYDNANYLVKTRVSTYIFKTYVDDGEIGDLIKAENKTLLFLQKQENLKSPQPILFIDGSYIKSLEIDGENRICRMLSFIDGDFFGNIKHTKELFGSFGKFLAEMDADLQKHANTTIKARQWGWDSQYFYLNKKYIEDIPKAKDRSIVRYFFNQYEAIINPILPYLRKQIIHNDANEWNVLTKRGKVTGIIDFGDLAHSFLINELAVAISYACYDKENPVEWASVILKAYHKVLPLEEIELKILYYLIAVRLSISVCNSAHSKIINPDNTYASSSEKHAWKMLYLWLKTSPITAENTFRAAAGFPIKGVQKYNIKSIPS